MQFRTLRLSGFKSFVEPTEIEISAGLTGIVGPNGCGKSNIVEAMRWAMGETSAKRMRGGEMDDVIFSGSANRPARNIAEVILTVMNDGGQIPAIFEKFPELEVRRRIERGAGSDYRVNGRPVRARDVQLLFADAAIGASSPAMVSQGRISALIAAKPAERRFILEDAAGIGGLQSRRHEAELKLKAAETNLSQLDTVLETLRTQENALKRQARQAEKYRHVAGRIREIEALLLYCAWQEAASRQAVARRAFDDAESSVRAVMAEMASAAAGESVADAAIVVARQADQHAQHALRLLLQREQALHAERDRIAASRAQAERDIAHAETDLTHEARERDEAQTALGNLGLERDQLVAKQPGAAKDIESAESAERTELAALRALEDQVLTASTAIAREEAQEAALTRQVNEATLRFDQSARKLEAARQSLAALTVGEIPDELPELAARAVDAHTELESAQAATGPARNAKERADSEAAGAREKADAAQAAQTRMNAEISGLEAGLSTRSQAGTQAEPVLNSLVVTTGFERGVAAALGEDALAAIDPNAGHRWVGLPDGTLSPPPGTSPLSQSVTSPEALHRTLSGVGIASSAEAARLQRSLLPGQAIVTPEGTLYRWDGLVREAALPAADPVAATLTQRNRIAQLRSELAAAEKVTSETAANLDAARLRADAATQAERTAMAAVATAMSLAQSADAALAAARLRGEQAARRLAQARTDADETVQRHAEATEARDAIMAERAALPALETSREQLRIAQQTLTAGRSRLSAAAALTRETRQIQERLAARLSAIADETKHWQDRIHSRAERLAEIGRRMEDARTVLGSFGTRPEEIEAELTVMLSRLEEAERSCRTCSDAVISAETVLADKRREARQCEQRLAAAREDRVRVEALMENATGAVAESEARIGEKLHVAPGALAASIESEGLPPERGELEARLATLIRERDGIGPVNLRAEVELQETAGEIARIEGERDDLQEAIARLRQAIGKLNREARERLAAAFETVRVHFKRLFATLFGGGEAELALTDLDDPLEAGLEIFASPPGKKLQILSLLSGGEQALTALALLFAMFLATPAPVCVLDEVDAPLDDANVTRFCDLLDEIAAQTGTRFLVITHHRVTMARMDRLYGVTMAERGVSMLVSVDLRAAESLVDHGEDTDTPRLAGLGGTR